MSLAVATPPRGIPSIPANAARLLAQQCRPSLAHFREHLLVWLRACSALSEAQAAAASARAGHGVRIEAALLELGVDARALVRGMLSAKGRFAADVGPYVSELAIRRHIPKSLAHVAGILPVAMVGETLYAYTDRAQSEATETLRVGSRDLRVFIVGHTSQFARDLQALYAGLSALDPETSEASFPEYLVLRGLLPAAERSKNAEHIHDAEHWASLAVRLGANEEEAYVAAAAFFDVPFVNEGALLALADGKLEPPPVPRGYLDALGFCAASRLDHQLICVGHRVPQTQAVEDFRDWYAVKSVVLCVTTPTAYRAHVRNLYEGPAESVDESIGEASLDISLESMNLERFPEIPRQFNRLLLEAIRARASDIHVERTRAGVAVRLRIDGAFVPHATPWLSAENALAFVTKVKVDSKLDISERRRPQDGVLRRRVGERTVDFRVAIQPTLWGESVVLRVLDQSKGAPLLSELGMHATLLAEFERLIESPHGLILLTGPTGSGKTTTLYAALQQLTRGGPKILTAEDPVEYAMEGVQQSQVNELIGNTFDRFLRAFLRQDPDVILVGEVRDPPTAEMTLRAALTGHLVFSTLHVNDALGTVRRLSDLGISLNILSESLLCVLSQRLVRRVCSACAEPSKPDPVQLHEVFGAEPTVGDALLSGRGCEGCRGTGYKGRVALTELWVPTLQERELIQRGASTMELRDRALGRGLRPLLEDARDKIRQGITTLQEVRSVMSFEELHRGG